MQKTSCRLTKTAAGADLKKPSAVFFRMYFFIKLRRYFYEQKHPLGFFNTLRYPDAAAVDAGPGK
jgi:hypothetical protein